MRFFSIQITGVDIVVQNEFDSFDFNWNTHGYMDLPKILLLDIRATKYKMHLK